MSHPHSHAWARGRAGFTLIEVMVSVALLATAFTSLLVLQRQAVASHYTMERITIASMLAEDRMERMILKAQGFDGLSEFNDDLNQAYPGYDINSELEEVDMNTLPIVALLPEGLTLKRVSVVVSWNEGPRKKEYKLQHFVTQKLL